MLEYMEINQTTFMNMVTISDILLVTKVSSRDQYLRYQHAETLNSETKLSKDLFM